MTARITIESKPATRNSVPTYLNWPGVYCAVAALEPDGEFLDAIDGLFATGASPCVVTVPAGFAVILIGLLDETLIFLRFDFCGMESPFLYSLCSWMSFFISPPHVLGS